MPFTFSHPAIVLPFLRLRYPSICFSALVVGSMIPDFEYFIRMKLGSRYSHTIPGLFLFDLPVAFVTLIIFHTLMKKPLIASLPEYMSSRLQPLSSFDFPAYLKKHPFGLIVCILIGAASHIVWDGFTHADGLFAPVMPVLLQVISINGWLDLPLYRILQHVSTLAGAFFIGYVFHKMPAYPSLGKFDLTFWTWVVLFFTVTLVVRMSFGVEYYGEMVVILISSGMIGLILASAVARLNGIKRNEEQN